ncbi:hypothetical protein EI42_00597 [Thermosporothrix hazakensis]|jgi:hypothetical protein|uniref:Uncharacterized protein n=2 Tax=Thermosporothrix TaxID=768650 RepID=A0A326UV39_THEHA|nr:hypothetical protein [Thermosporothrix hazakensis]PZW36423.1 hypothetical protein EI42_00597 [Thermosporothrix hazakensis]BBH88890.1 hypothetical protein KTC_36410 [Thermosporothrix sp. COM3]GCE47075.1 hypothetical protein KTH_19440 [Thermosporothrix hazakensis]
MRPVEKQTTVHYFPAHIEALYARLGEHDVEQFYQGYKLWKIQQQIIALQTELTALNNELKTNEEQTQRVQPSPIALAALARLQASGVHDLDLLDRMLSRGDIWLDHTMQLLERCESLDLIQGDYTTWCENALDGAYNWLDSIQEGQRPPEAAEEESAITEEMLLQKLTNDDEGELPTHTEKPSQPEQVVEEQPTIGVVYNEAARAEEKQLPSLEALHHVPEQVAEEQPIQAGIGDVPEEAKEEQPPSPKSTLSAEQAEDQQSTQAGIHNVSEQPAEEQPAIDGPITEPQETPETAEKEELVPVVQTNSQGETPTLVAEPEESTQKRKQPITEKISSVRLPEEGRVTISANVPETPLPEQQPTEETDEPREQEGTTQKKPADEPHEKEKTTQETTINESSQQEKPDRKTQEDSHDIEHQNIFKRFLGQLWRR